MSSNSEESNPDEINLLEVTFLMEVERDRRTNPFIKSINQISLESGEEDQTGKESIVANGPLLLGRLSSDNCDIKVSLCCWMIVVSV